MISHLFLDPENKSTVALFFLSILNYILQFLFTSYLTHHLTPALYGDFNLSLSFLAITANLALLGTQTTAVKFLPRYLQLKDSSILENFLSWIFKITGISFITCLCISFLIATAMFFFHAVGYKHLSSYELVIFTLWITPFTAFAMLLQKFILGNNRPVASYILQNDFTYLTQLTLFMLAISVIGIQLNSLSFSLILILSYAFIILVSLSFIQMHNERFFSYIKEHLIDRRHQVCPEWKKMSIKVILIGIIYYVIVALDLFILKVITPDKSQVGIYSVAWIICNIFIIAPKSIYTLILPQIDLYTQRNASYPISSFQKLLNKINGVVGIILLIFVLIVLVLGKEILFFFGPQYASAYLVLVICIFTAVLSSLSVSGVNLLLYSSNINTLLAIDIVNFSLTLVLGIVLTYFYNIIGISVARLIVQAAITILLVVYAKKKTMIKSLTVF